jgi:hypothetical protein
MNNDEVASAAQALLDQANEMYRKGKEVGTVMSVLLIATTARSMLAPEVKYVGLDHSDQGDFLSLAGALTADKEDLHPDFEDEVWDAFTEEAESSFAWNLDLDDRALWGQYLLKQPREGTGWPWLLDVDDVIARLSPTL